MWLLIELFDWYVQVFAKENLELLNWTSVLTAGVVVSAPLSYVIKRWHTNKTEKKNNLKKSACRTTGRNADIKWHGKTTGNGDRC